MLIQVMCVISFMAMHPDGYEEKRVYKAIGFTNKIHLQYWGVDFSRWAKANKVDMPWHLIKVNGNNCNIMHEFQSQEAADRSEV